MTTPARELLLVLAFAIVPAIGFSACEINNSFSSDGTLTAANTPTGKAIKVMGKHCMTSGCHFDWKDYTTDDDYLSDAKRGPLFTPGDAEASEFYNVIVRGEMPPGGLPISEAEQAAIKTWINSMAAE